MKLATRKKASAVRTLGSAEQRIGFAMGALRDLGYEKSDVFKKLEAAMNAIDAFDFG